MFKTETHLHVAQISPCSHISAEEMIKLYFEAGYKTVFVSDHFYPAYFDALGDKEWNEKTHLFFSGYRAARKTGKEYGVNVLMSAEIGFAGNPNHYLVYGITEEIVNACPNLCNGKPEDFFKYAREKGVLVIQAHPNRDGYCFPTPEIVDGMEVYNSNPRHNDYSDKTAEIAKEYSLYTSAGSDAHRYEDVGKSGIVTETEIKTAEDFIAVIKSGKFEIIKG